MTTGERIKAARLRAGLTQQELADKIGISYQGIGQWERDARNPKIETLSKIAAALNVPVRYLMGYDELRDVATHKISTRDMLQDLLTERNIDALAQLMGTTPELVQGFFDIDDAFDAHIMRALLYQISSTLSGDEADSKEAYLLTMFRKLNYEGKEKAVERVEELTEVPKYRN